MTEHSDLLIRQAQWPEDSSELERLRSAVFVLEQGVPRDIEWDGRDAEAQHVIAELAGAAVGCGRLLPDGRIGRLAVLAQYRGQGIGAKLLTAIVEIARQRGQQTLYLHAQAKAVSFYQRAGFTVRGEPFDEAGILHLDMHSTLDYRDWDEPVTQLRYPQPFAELVIAQATLARRELRILSPRLDPRVFDNEDLESAIRSFLRGGSLCNVQILVQDARAIVQRGHRLLALSRRLPSRVEIRRLAEHPQWNGETLVMRDRGSLLEMPGTDTDYGFYRPKDRARTEAAINHFAELWRLGHVDPEFRALSI
ncbi:GNAT family N-acetyltransferase [Congregibacter variabilis]|uniref:GNAT family N-acetyltransferase n=1 Tax=Congregibacter variabilis TaxID=3081200 RepID=A0ABZ0I4T9_9GAMM|nr:GNAT family N-acetyltransferase [Congregibacter sp. IMCC43200]